LHYLSIYLQPNKPLAHHPSHLWTYFSIKLITKILYIKESLFFKCITFQQEGILLLDTGILKYIFKEMFAIKFAKSNSIFDLHTKLFWLGMSDHIPFLTGIIMSKRDQGKGIQKLED